MPNEPLLTGSAISLLELHPSFWTHEKGFYRWQILRRKTEYCEAEVFRFRSSAIFTESLHSRYYQPYPAPLISNETFSRWAGKVRQHGPRAKALDGKEREILTASDFLPEGLRLPENWLPVPPDIVFPHPNILERLTTSGIGVAVTTVAFPGMETIRIEGKPFWVDLCFSLSEICSDLFGYLELEGSRSWSGGRESLTRRQVKQRSKIRLELKKQLKWHLVHRKRDSSKIARALEAYDMKERGYTRRQIAETLRPDEVARLKRQGKKLRDVGSRSTVLDWAKDHVNYARYIIEMSFSPID